MYAKLPYRVFFSLFLFQCCMCSRHLSLYEDVCFSQGWKKGVVRWKREDVRPGERRQQSMNSWPPATTSRGCPGRWGWLCPERGGFCRSLWCSAAAAVPSASSPAWHHTPLWGRLGAALKHDPGWCTRWPERVRSRELEPKLSPIPVAHTQPKARTSLMGLSAEPGTQVHRPKAACTQRWVSHLTRAWAPGWSCPLLPFVCHLSGQAFIDSHTLSSFYFTFRLESWISSGWPSHIRFPPGSGMGIGPSPCTLMRLQDFETPLQELCTIWLLHAYLPLAPTSWQAPLSVTASVHITTLTSKPLYRSLSQWGPSSPALCAKPSILFLLRSLTLGLTTCFTTAWLGGHHN